LFDGTNFPAISGTMTGSGDYLKNLRFLSQGVLLATGALTAPICRRIQETDQLN